MIVLLRSLLQLSLLLSLSQSSFPLPLSQYQSILKLKELLDISLGSIASETPTDICSLNPSQTLNLVCYEDNLTQLHISGANDAVSAPYLFEIVSSIPTLKVLSLVSLGLSGPMPSLQSLTSLEILNVSFNRFTGDVPRSISYLTDMQTLIMDNNNFTGPVPSWFDSLPSLSVLSLNHNMLSGFLPSSLSTMENLRILSVSYNNITGDVPCLKGLTSLEIFDVGGNSIGPKFPEVSSGIVSLVLKSNMIRFGVPEEIDSFRQLQVLDISWNELDGPFRSSLFSLPSLSFLDVSHNMFKGLITENVSCGSKLAYADFSSNLFTGRLPSCLADEKVARYERNCFPYVAEQNPSSFCSDEALAVAIHPRGKENRKGSYSRAAIAASFGAFTILGFVVVAMRKRNRRNGEDEPKARVIEDKVSIVDTEKLISDARILSQMKKVGDAVPYRTFSLEIIKEATTNFCDSILQEKMSGSVQICLGKLLDGNSIAVKCLKLKKKELTKVVELISKLRHRNVLTSLGHCLDYTLPNDSTTIQIFFVFEFFSNTTLRDLISGTKGENLNWMQRIAASTGIARGIQFLRRGIVPPFSSIDLKITDVLLDEEFNVKIRSYSLPLFSENKPSVSVTCLGGKSDLRDFGIILLEVLVGRALISGEDINVMSGIVERSLGGDCAARRNAVDPLMRMECVDESLRIMMDLCLRCLSDDPSERPSIDDVLWNLMFAAQVQDPSKGDSNNYSEFVGSTPLREF